MLFTLNHFICHRTIHLNPTIRADFIYQISFRIDCKDNIQECNPYPVTLQYFTKKRIRQQKYWLILQINFLYDNLNFQIISHISQDKIAKLHTVIHISNPHKINKLTLTTAKYASKTGYKSFSTWISCLSSAWTLYSQETEHKILFKKVINRDDKRSKTYFFYSRKHNTLYQKHITEDDLTLFFKNFIEKHRWHIIYSGFK